MQTALIAAGALLAGVIVTGLFGRWNESRRHDWDVDRENRQHQRDKDSEHERYQRQVESDRIRWERERKIRYDERRLETYFDLLHAVMAYASPDEAKPEFSPVWVKAINLVLRGYIRQGELFRNNAATTVGL